MPDKDNYGNYYAVPKNYDNGVAADKRLTLTIKTITPTDIQKEEAMINVNSEGEQEWHLIKDGFYDYTGPLNDQSAYIRVNKGGKGRKYAKVLDNLTGKSYDPNWFTSGANIFGDEFNDRYAKRNIYQGETGYPTYNAADFKHGTLNFPTHMHYSAGGKMLVPNKAASWFTEEEVQFSNDVTDYGAPRNINCGTPTTRARIKSDAK